MRYSYEYKLKCVEMYRQREWPETPEGIKNAENFHQMIRKWDKIEKANGPEALKHKSTNKVWLPEEKLKLISEVLAGKSGLEVASKYGINNGLLYQWIQKYKTMGYNGLVTKKQGSHPKEPIMKNAISPTPLTESEREELIRLRAEIEYMKAENEVIKKEIALREERQAAQLKAKKQLSSKNSENKDIT